MSCNGKAGSAVPVALAGQTGIEYDSTHIFKWTIKNFNIFEGNREIINAQKIQFDVEVTDTLPAMAWGLSLSCPSEPVVNFLIVTYNCNVHGDYPQPMYKAQLSYMAMDKVIKKESKVLQLGLRTSATGTWQIPLQNIRTWNNALNDGVLALELRLEFYRNCNAVIGEISLPTERWNKNHEHSRKMYLLDMLKSGHFSDVKIVSNDGQEFHAHKLILKAGSEVFEAMFRNEMSESTTGIVKLDDMSGRAVTFLLHFLYSSEILPISGNEDDNTGENATIDEVLYLASKYELKELIIFLDENISSFCNEENVCSLLQLCKLYSLENGKEMIFDLVQKNQWKVLREFVLSRL